MAWFFLLTLGVLMGQLDIHGISRSLDSIVDWPFDTQSPVDLLDKRGLNVLLEDDGSSPAVPQGYLDALHDEADPTFLTLDETGDYQELRISAALGRPFQMLAGAVSFGRAANRQNPTMWHKLDRVSAWWGIDLRGAPEAYAPTEQEAALINDNLTVAAKTFQSSDYQVNVSVQVGAVSRLAVNARPADGICIAFDRADVETGISVWGSNAIDQGLWTKIQPAGLSSYGWNNGFFYNANTQSVTGAKSLTILFEKTEVYAYYKVVFNAPIQAETDICEIIILNLHGELCYSADGDSYIHPAGIPTEEFLPSTEGRQFFDSKAMDGITFDDQPVSWPGGSTIASVRDAVRHPVSGDIYALLMSSTNVMWLARFTVDDDTGVITYAARTDITTNHNESRHLCLYETATPGTYRIAVSGALTKIQRFSVPDIAAVGDPFDGSPTYDILSGVASDGVKIWAIAALTGGNGIMDILEFDETDLTIAPTTPINVHLDAEILEGGASPLFYNDGSLYMFTCWQAPYWRKYNSTTYALEASRSIGPVDNYGNEVDVFQNGALTGGLAVDSGYVYSLMQGTYNGAVRYIIARFTTSFGQIDWTVIPDTPNEYTGLSVEPSGAFFILSGSTSGGTVGIIARRRVFFADSVLSLNVMWPIVLVACAFIKFFYHPWSFSGYEDGIIIRRIWAFNDPRGLSVTRDSGGGQPVQAVQLQSGKIGEIGIAEQFLATVSTMTQQDRRSGGSLSIMSKAAPRSESMVLPDGVTSFQLLDRYGRPALFILNADGDGLARAGDTSLAAPADPALADLVEWGTPLTLSGQYRVNWAYGIVESFDATGAGAETLTFKVPDYGAFSVEFGSDGRGWSSFQGVFQAPFSAQGSARFSLRSNLGYFGSEIGSSKRLFVIANVIVPAQIERDAQARLSPAHVGDFSIAGGRIVPADSGGDSSILERLGIAEQVNPGRSSSRAVSNRLSPELRLIQSVARPDTVSILVYLDVFAAFTLRASGKVVAAASGQILDADYLPASLRTETHIGHVSSTLPFLLKSIDLLPTTAPEPHSSADFLPAEAGYEEQHAGRLAVASPATITAIGRVAAAVINELPSRFRKTVREANRDIYDEPGTEPGRR